MSYKIFVFSLILCGMSSVFSQTTEERITGILTQTANLKTQFAADEDFVELLESLEETLENINAADSTM